MAAEVVSIMQAADDAKVCIERHKVAQLLAWTRLIDVKFLIAHPRFPFDDLEWSSHMALTREQLIAALPHLAELRAIAEQNR